MKKLLFLIILLKFSYCGIAQSWCPPGAEWYNDQVCLCPTKDIMKVVYSGTMMVAGNVCQQLSKQIYSRNYFTNQLSISSSVPTFTTYSFNNIVFLYSSITNSFDTIYNFNAVPGDTWRIPGFNTPTGSPKTKFTVYDTGHSVISGINLKWIKVWYSNPTKTDIIYERIGATRNFFFNFFYDDGFNDVPRYEYLRCYNDYQINFTKITIPCDSIPSVPNAINEPILIEKIKIYPNTVTNKLTIEIIEGVLQNYNITITNGLGSTVMKQDHVLSTLNLDTVEWPQGMLFLTVENDQLKKTYKIIKE